ncbi:MAG TPA: DUF2141 domain-containing protein [Steroidobacteraceae bacterium]|nr:DUF2141 domain-containing protein [Steroidobacteraceae bacterium]
MTSVRRIFALIATLSLTIGGNAEASEEFEAKNVAVCGAEIAQMCAAVKKGGGRVIQCLQEKVAALSPECKKVVVPDDGAAGKFSIEVTVVAINSKAGSINVMLSDDPDEFPSAPRRMVIVPANAGAVVVTFKHLKPGEYAVMAYHDANENSKFDTGSTPSEGIAVSNNAFMPTFSASAIAVARDTKIKLALNYL